MTSCGDENIATGEDQQPVKAHGDGVDIERLKAILVPCGFPIDGHSFAVVEKKKGEGSKRIGCLHVKGTGVALGYLNDEAETSNNFSTVDTCDTSKESDDGSVVVFNTMDMAFQEQSSVKVGVEEN